jgi:hypothetical protein
MLSVPPVPWAREKLLMREAMQGHLPREILHRRKTPLAVEKGRWPSEVRPHTSNRRHVVRKVL